MLKIVCPNCKAEYTPYEIFTPSDYFYNYVPLEKNEEGKIIEEIDEDFSESYTCDYCGRTIHITPKIDFKCSVDGLKKHTTKLKKPTLFMAED